MVCRSVPRTAHLAAVFLCGAYSSAALTYQLQEWTDFLATPPLTKPLLFLHCSSVEGISVQSLNQAWNRFNLKLVLPSELQQRFGGFFSLARLICCR